MIGRRRRSGRTPAGRRAISPAFRALADSNYRRYIVGAVVSNIGSWTHRFAQDWLVLQLTGSGTALGINTALQFLPTLLLSPTTGAVADRAAKRRLLRITQASLGLGALILGALAITGLVELWHVYLCAVAFGIGTAYDSPARHSVIPAIVATDDVSSAVGLNAASFHLARIIGPAAGSGLIVGLGSSVAATGWVMTIAAVCFGLIVYGLRWVRVTEAEAVAVQGRGMVRAGFRYVRNHMDLLLVLAVSAVAGTFSFTFQITYALMATQTFGKDADGLGLILSVMSIGALTGTLLVARRKTATTGLVLVTAIVFGIVEMLAGVMPSYLAFALWSPLLGLSAYALVTAANTMVQLNTAAEYRGRVMALYVLAWMGGVPLGATVMGWVGQTLGARWTLIGGGALTLAAALLAGMALRSRSRRSPDRGPEQPER